LRGCAKNPYIEKNICSQKIEDLLEQIQSARISDQISEVRGLRNIFVHYGLGNFPQQKINKEFRLFGLIEHYFNGASFSTIDKFLNRKIHMLSEIANNWLFN